MRKQKQTPPIRNLARALSALAMVGLVHTQANAQNAPMPAPALKPDKTMPAQPSASAAAPAAEKGNDALFKRIDTDADGSISKAELEKFDPEAAKSFEKYDSDKDSRLSPVEFDAMVKGLRGG